MPRLVIDIAPLCLTMSTPNAQAPKPLKGLRKLALRHNQPPRIAPSPEPPEMKTEWIEPLLTTARLGAALGEACPIPYVKGAFNITVFFLESVRKMKKNKEGLKDLCTDIDELLKIIEPYIVTQSSNVEHKLRELCKDFEKFMHSLQDMVHGIQKQDNSTQGKIRAFFQTDTTREQLATHNEQLKSFMARIQLLATLDIHHHVISATASEVLSEISSCPPASRIFHGRQIILESMEQFFASNQSEQQIYVLYGLGGSGKTQIALKFIEQPKARFTHKFFVDASSPETITNNFKMITSMLNIPEETVGGAMSWLASKFEEWLLLFDNADDTNLGLNDFFPQCKHGNIIITTRNPELRVYGAYSQVSNMEEDDAVQLLLMSAAQELCCFPLAIIQAGAYIAKSQDLAGYLGLYADNRVQLLSKKLVQSHDKYAWTVYTTWQLSFERLGQVAQEFLMLCSHLHHEGISENIFKSASVYVCTKQWPSEPDLVVCKKFLAHFYGLDSRWSSMKFRDVVNEILSFSLMDFKPGRQVLSMHPLVHRWCSEVVADSALYNNCIHGVLGMCIGATSELHHLGSMLVPHLLATYGNNMDNVMVPDFRQEYARVYYWAGYHNKARQLQLNVLAKCYSLLGEHHPDTLTAMANLAITHRQLGELDDAKALEIDVLAKRHNLLGEHHPDTLTAMANLAYTHTEVGKLVDAKSLEIEVVAKHHNLLGEHHPDTLTAMQNLANTHRQLGELNNAKALEIDVLAKRHNLLGEHHPDTLRAMANLVITHTKLGELDDAKALGIDVLAKRHNLLGEHHPDTLTAMQNLAYTHRQLGELNDSKALEFDVLAKRHNLLGEHHPDTLTAMANLAVTHTELGELDDAKALEIDVLAKRHNLLGEHHPDTLTAMQNLAVTHKELGELDDAKALEIDVLAKRHNLLGEHHPDTLTAMQNLAYTHRQLGELDDAKALQIDVLATHHNLHGEYHPNTLTAMAHLAITHGWLGELHDAKALEIDVLAKRRNLLGEHHPDTLTAMQNLAITHRRLGELDDAKALQIDVLAKRQNLLGEHHRDTLTAMQSLAITQAGLGELDNAKALEIDVLAKHHNLLGEHHPDTLTAMQNLAVIHVKRGELDDAKALEIDVLAKRHNLLGEHHPNTLRAMANLAYTHRQLGELDEAKALEILMESTTQTH
ncbi:hypothetical protein GGX14DRAFT_546758 [Mycena pura]|uniref:NB-ARC domain-containing protein n=1 Tax=Mycena pura TaxID=153505 RepID=A0AAD6UMT2_9AGAR|nr:hypothetical protein GGX14DRAFT_546758 [Mycena pura]